MNSGGINGGAEITKETNSAKFIRVFCVNYRMTAVETSVTTTNSLSQVYTNLDGHISQTSIDTPRFKPLLYYHIVRNIITLQVKQQLAWLN